MKKPTKSPRAANPSSRANVRPKQTSFELTDDIRARIALKAYELYEQRGQEGDREMEDWLAAETIVMEEIRRSGS